MHCKIECRQDRKQLAGLFQTERFQNLSVETVQEIAVHLRMKGLTRKIKREAESVAMCKAVDDWLADERNEGRQDGIREGEMKGKGRQERRKTADNQKNAGRGNGGKPDPPGYEVHESRACSSGRRVKER